MILGTWWEIYQSSKFLGTKDKPIAISEREVSKLLQDITEGVDNPKPKFEYEVGEQIKVSDGPFASFSGIIEEVDSSRQKLKVSVSIFWETDTFRARLFTSG